MQIKEVIILAGGLGTRLRSAVPELPKCMAPILAKPFIGYLIDYLLLQGVTRFIFSLGYKSNIIEQYIDTQYGDMERVYSVETEPLGTGGAIKLAISHARSKDVIVMNGDTFFRCDLSKLSAFHMMCGADCTLCLKPMKSFDRYGVVELNKDYSIREFQEKKYYEEGFINGGVYALNVSRFSNASLPSKFSFEKDYLEAHNGRSRMFGLIQDAYFIDIGIPSDFEKAQTELILNI